MTPLTSCEHVQERLSDHRDGALDADQRRSVEEHLRGCAECRRLHAALEELAPLLRGLAGSAEPSPGLAQRAALAALRARPAPRPIVLAFPPRPRYRPAVPAPLQAAAAVAMMIAGTAGLVTGPDAAPARVASRMVERTGMELSQQRDRLLEELRELAAAVGTAVETRMDRVEDRVDDYRRLLEERQQRSRPEPTESRIDSAPGRSARQLAEPRPGVLRSQLTRAQQIAAQDAGTSPRRRS